MTMVKFGSYSAINRSSPLVAPLDKTRRRIHFCGMPNDFVEIQRGALGTSLNRCHLFAALPPHDLERIASLVVQKRLKRGEYLFRRGAPFEGFYVVQQGAIGLRRVGPSGKGGTIHVFREDESFAESALAEKTDHLEDARAIEQSTLLLVPKNAFLELLQKQPELALRIFGTLIRELQRRAERIGDLSLKDTQTRLAGWLLRRCRRPLEDKAVAIDLGRTKDALAAEFGLTLETLSRTLADLRNRKLISVKGGTVTIQKPLELEELFRRNIGEV
jgi:CRP/FNR family transcriptional regulator, dissimilatory nitrate respiration regulator